MKQVIIICYAILFSQLASCQTDRAEEFSKKEKKIVFTAITNCKDGIEISGFKIEKELIPEIAIFFNYTRYDDHCKFDTTIFNRTYDIFPIIMCLFDETGLKLENGSFDSEERFIDFRNELLFTIKNKKLLHLITDSLLNKNNGTGIEALWLDLNKEELKNLSNYVENTDSWYQLAELVSIFHSQEKTFDKEKIMRNRVFCAPEFNEEREKLKTLMKKHKVITLSLFNETFFDQ